MVGRSHHEWPMESYLTAWKMFRLLSDENRATAQHIVSRSHWPRRGSLSLLDLGCGDGRLVEQVALLSPDPITRVTLVDPDAELLSEAEATIRETETVQEVTTIQLPLEDVDKNGFSAILLVHVVYLLREESLP